MESARATETWHRIVQEVNKVGTQKTTKQCKDKIRNLKKSYKEAKANNNKTGRPRQTSPYYDSFDEVLGTRAVVTMPGVIQCGQAESDDMSQDLSGTIESESDEESDSEMNGSEGSESSPNAAVEKQPKRKKTGRSRPKQEREEGPHNNSKRNDRFNGKVGGYAKCAVQDVGNSTETHRGLAD